MSADEKVVSRRKLIGNAGKLVGGTAAGAGLLYLSTQPGVQAQADGLPERPWPFARLDTEMVRKRGHLGYYEGACCYGAFQAIVTSLGDSVGGPYNQIPLDMMKYGEGGIAGFGSLCGGLNGACAAINLALGGEGGTYKKLVHELAGWYTEALFPSEISNQYAKNHEFLVDEYKSDEILPQSAAESTLCHVSVTKWCQASGFASGATERSERCARLTGDVAAKAAELLNQADAGEFESAFTLPAAVQGCRSCHFKGDDFEQGQFTRGKENCIDCHGQPHE